jgi:hypothetical protein
LEIWKSRHFTNITRTWSIQMRECYWISFVWRNSVPLSSNKSWLSTNESAWILNVKTITSRSRNALKSKLVKVGILWKAISPGTRIIKSTFRQFLQVDLRRRSLLFDWTFFALRGPAFWLLTRRRRSGVDLNEHIRAVTRNPPEKNWVITILFIRPADRVPLEKEGWDREWITIRDPETTIDATAREDVS